jgi:hypothetical protein
VAGKAGGVTKEVQFSNIQKYQYSYTVVAGNDGALVKPLHQ